MVSRLAGGGNGGMYGMSDDVGSYALFFNPSGVAISTLGTVYVADNGNHLIRMISPTGTDNARTILFIAIACTSISSELPV